MNIQILDSWLREYLKTEEAPEKIAEILSLTSVSVEKLERYKDADWTYDIEVTTNRPDLMSVTGLAREAAAVLSQAGIPAEFDEPKLKRPEKLSEEVEKIEIRNNPELVDRICAVIMEVALAESPGYIKERLEASGIRSLNNVIDITNYIMREIGHPTHVFDYDRLTTKRLEIRKSWKNEKVMTLDKHEHKLPGGDIVADDGLGHIVDLLGVMGVDSSVVTNDTKRILFFVDTVKPEYIRYTSMTTGIRTDAAILNEKGIDPELAYTALLRGVMLYKEAAHGKTLSNFIDIYPNRKVLKTVITTFQKINSVIGVEIPRESSTGILKSLGFGVLTHDETLEVTVPSYRRRDVTIQEDIIEEIARVYGYHKLPSVLPSLTTSSVYNRVESEFYWEARVKEALKYWGFTEVYTYSLVSADHFEGPTENAVTLKNPLTEDSVYLRNTLVPSLLAAIRDNPARDDIMIFELANVYIKKKGQQADRQNLPDEILTLAGVVKGEKATFSKIKGILEALFQDLGIKGIIWKAISKGGLGADMYIEKTQIGYVEVLEDKLIDFECNFETILKHVSLSKTYKPVSKFPPVIEDIRVVINPAVNYEQIVSLIKKQGELVADVFLLDVYRDKKTFRVKYQNPEKNLTTEDVTPVRQKIISVLETKLHAKVT